MAKHHEPYMPTAEDYAKAYDTLEFLMGMVEANHLAVRQPRDLKTTLALVIVSGFLGAGKTTLMRHLLTANHGLRITALVNDVATLNIDAALIAEVSEDTLALANGCVCCSQSGGVARALTSLVNNAYPPDLVLLEASGIANPWALAQVVESVPGITVECIVTVVDAAHVMPDASVEYLLRRQVEAADLILLNKIDLVTNREADRTADHIAQLAPRAEIVRTINCAVPCGIVFETRRTTITPTSGLEEIVADDRRFCTISLAATVPIKRHEIEARLAALPAGVLRAKGLLRFVEAPDGVWLLQLVGRRWRWERSSERRVRLEGMVVIGLANEVDEASLAAHFSPLGFNRVAADRDISTS